jgi:hypothetical protein
MGLATTSVGREIVVAIGPVPVVLRMIEPSTPFFIRLI